MRIRPIIVAAIGSALLMGIVLPVATAQAPPCFTFADGQTQAFQCPTYFRPAPVQYYSNAQSNLYQQTTDDGELPSGFFDQQTINTLRQRAAQNQSQNAIQPQQFVVTPVTNATNLTSTDIEPIRNGLNTVRESLERNDTQAAIESINRADGALFAIVHEGRGPVAEELIKLSDAIDATRQSVFSLDNERTLEGLNAADSQLSVITEMLSTPTPTENPEPQTQVLNFGEEQSPANQNETLPPLPEPEPIIQTPTPAPAPEEPIIRIPLNKTQQELVTIEEVAGLNKTTHEKTTITILQGNKTTHRDVTTTEVPLPNQ